MTRDLDFLLAYVEFGSKRDSSQHHLCLESVLAVFWSVFLVPCLASYSGNARVGYTIQPGNLRYVT